MTPENGEHADEAWDTGDLGRNAEYVRKTPAEQEAEVEETLDLQMISIRLQKELIRELKVISQYHRIGYQPLIRDILTHWARSELISIAERLRKEQQAAAELAATVVAKQACG